MLKSEYKKFNFKKASTKELELLKKEFLIDATSDKIALKNFI